MIKLTHLSYKVDRDNLLHRSSDEDYKIELLLSSMNLKHRAKYRPITLFKDLKLFRRLCLAPLISQSFKRSQLPTFTPPSLLSIDYRSQFI